jgi:hypothetical protein
VIALASARLLLAVLTGWLNCRHQESMAYLIKENRILWRQLRGRLRLTDDERRRLALHGYRLVSKDSADVCRPELLRLREHRSTCRPVDPGHSHQV